MDELLKKINSLQQTANKFHIWLQRPISATGFPGRKYLVAGKNYKAAEHFVQELTPLIEFLQQSPAVTDSRLHAKEYNEV